MRGGLERWRRYLLSFSKYTLRMISPTPFFKKKNQKVLWGFFLGSQYSVLRFDPGGKGERNIVLFMHDFRQGVDYLLYRAEGNFLKRSCVDNVLHSIGMICSSWECETGTDSNACSRSLVLACPFHTEIIAVSIRFLPACLQQRQREKISVTSSARTSMSGRGVQLNLPERLDFCTAGGEGAASATSPSLQCEVFGSVSGWPVEMGLVILLLV